MHGLFVCVWGGGGGGTAETASMHAPSVLSRAAGLSCCWVAVCDGPPYSGLDSLKHTTPAALHLLYRPGRHCGLADRTRRCTAGAAPRLRLEEVGVRMLQEARRAMVDCYCSSDAEEGSGSRWN